MLKTTLEEYKKAVKAKYEKEKMGRFSSSLLTPSRAKLRDLCFELFKSNTNSDDLQVFSSFCGFEFSVEHRNKLNNKTDKFRKVENFFKGETVPAVTETINMAAILVDFHPRPFLKFSKGISINEEKVEVPVEEQINTIITKAPDIPIHYPTPEKPKKQLNKKIIVTFILLGVLGIGYSVKQIAFPAKQCMEWQKDHYEPVDCSSEPVEGITRIPLDESLLDFRRIWACDTTTFFKDGKAVVYYYKDGDEVQLFNKLALHPIHQKPLKAITGYMINTHLSNNKQTQSLSFKQENKAK